MSNCPTSLSYVPEADFAELKAELERESIAVNYDRATAGKGRSQAFGLIRRWSYRPHLSRNTWIRPKLYQLLLDFAQKHIPLPWDGITVNDSYISAPHKDKGNQGLSCTVSFGDFTGGNLCMMDGSGHPSIEINTRHTVWSFDGANTVHWTAPFEGRRFCLVFYSIVWPTKFQPPYTIRCRLEADGLRIEDSYDESIVVLDRKGKVVRELQPPKWMPWIGRLTRLAQPSRNPPPVPDSAALPGI